MLLKHDERKVSNVKNQREEKGASSRVTRKMPRKENTMGKNNNGMNSGGQGGGGKYREEKRRAKKKNNKNKKREK